jgi:nicotinamide-nucleotide amidase
MATAEILAIGTELLLGHVLDTNSQFLAQELASLGIDCFFRSTVGDNKTRIKEAVKAALMRSDILITTGGLGPTADDLTTESLAELFNAPLDFDQNILAKIEQFFLSTGYPMPETNRKQALRPKGAATLPNVNGTAPGIIWQLDKELLSLLQIPAQPKVILTFPGVPRELYPMWAQTARPFLQKYFSGDTIWSCQLKHYGISESALAEKYAHLLDLKNPTVAPYAGFGECRLKVTAKAGDIDKAKAIAQPIIDEILKDSGSLCYGFDDQTLELVVGKLLIEQNKTLAVAESCTGGLVSKRLTDIPGSSAYIHFNATTYSNEAKENILNVPNDILNKYGAVSAKCAEAMANGIKKLAKSDIGLSITGIAGPEGGTAEKPIGLVYIGLAHDKNTESLKLDIPNQLSRENIRQRAASSALNLVRLFLLPKK